MDLSSLKSLLTENRNNYAQLQKQNSDLENTLRQLSDDFESISREHNRAQSERDRELADLRAQAEQRKQDIDAILENNVSLGFEISTYRRLLEVEESRLSKNAIGEGSSYNYPSGPPVNAAPDVSTKKMTVQKSARG
jgi:TolA-binding protein